MFEFLQNSLDIYAISFLLGLCVSIFLVLSKSLLIFLLFLKKQVALGTTVIVLSEAIIGLSLYLFIRRYEINSEYLMVGFVSGLVVSLTIALVVFAVKYEKRNVNDIDG